MKLTDALQLRRILNSSYHPFEVIVKPDVWQKRERMRRFVAWQYASKRTTVRRGTETMSKIFNYMNMQRTDEKHLKRFYSEERLYSALDAHKFEYKHLRNMLDEAHILINNNVLSQLAIYEPRTFKSIIHLTKAMSVEDGRLVMADEKEIEHVEVDDKLFREPLPRRNDFGKAPEKDHTNKPRKLRYDEF